MISFSTPRVLLPAADHLQIALSEISSDLTRARHYAEPAPTC